MVEAVETPAMSREVSDRDAMFTDEAHYFGVAVSALTCIRAGVGLSGMDPRSVHRILDLGCGHGRVMRGIRAEFPTAEIVGCDLDEDGVAFCARTFGAVPVVADPDLGRTALDGPFDLVWCGSLLTHLPLAEFGSVVGIISESLSEGGVAVLTVHGRIASDRMHRNVSDYGLGVDTARRLAADVGWQGYAYVDYPGASGYGIALCSPDWLLRFLAEAHPDLRVAAFSEAAWDNHQDVLVITPVGAPAPTAQP